MASARVYKITAGLLVLILILAFNWNGILRKTYLSNPLLAHSTEKVSNIDARETVKQGSEGKTPFGQNPAKWKLTFSEEFNHNELNESLWNNHIWFQTAAQTNDYLIKDGTLHIWPMRDKDGKFVERIFTTDGKYYQTYGYFEMEAKLPVGKGLWPAFWLMNHDDERTPFEGFFPLRPEIDIMEAYSGDTTGYWADKNFHPTAFGITVWSHGPQQDYDAISHEGGRVARKVVRTPDLSKNFHKYAVNWEPNKQTFYFDGKKVYSTNITMAQPNRMFILLALQYGSASGEPDHSTPTGIQNAFRINYIRAWAQIKDLDRNEVNRIRTHDAQKSNVKSK
jgi:beta-glucanase (GH16 family)